MHSLNFFGYKIGIKVNRDLLVVKQKKCATKIVNVYIVYELNPRPKGLLDIFTLKTCLVQKNYKDKSKRVYSGYRIAFDGKGLWSFGNGFVTYVVIFDVDNSSSSHSDNRKTAF